MQFLLHYEEFTGSYSSVMLHYIYPAVMYGFPLRMHGI